MMDEKTEETHESFGLIGFSRTQGNPGRLFGSPLTDHGSFMTLRISRAKRVTDDLGHEHYFGGMRGDLIEVKLSASQYAERKLAYEEAGGGQCLASGPTADLQEMDRKDVLWALEKVMMHYRSNAPYMAKVFQETTEALVGAAKAEVDAFITHNIVAEGLRSLAEKAIAAVPALPDPDEMVNQGTTEP